MMVQDMKYPDEKRQLGRDASPLRLYEAGCSNLKIANETLLWRKSKRKDKSENLVALRCTKRGKVFNIMIVLMRSRRAAIFLSILVRHLCFILYNNLPKLNKAQIRKEHFHVSLLDDVRILIYYSFEYSESIRYIVFGCMSQ